ncbi:MAG: cobyric acid synthase [Chloroflexota bacterium]|nr:cobyric acid synthase [Chloroflexota bacterium]
MSARTLMVQGTASDVGKSVLVAALCRILRQDGYRVAPFKAQNMALNAAVTIDGGEIGRSQAVQAAAAGIEPAVEMNPILLKPEAEARSQVIVRGRVWKTLPWREYYRERAPLLGVIRESLETLRAAYDVVVIEGAGSPAEINLKAGDIVNMRVAALADAPVLLAGDIDRGGVFAALLGTLELLDPDERARVRGLIINKFRGDLELLRPGLDFIAARTGVPLLGVVPHLPRLGLAEEDSVALERRANRPGDGGPAVLDIAVIQLPRISNFDDFDPLAAEDGVAVRFVRAADELGVPDLAIIPGTKSTIADLAALREAGLDRAIVALAGGGTPLVGICGGFQMLGEAIEDPHGVEADAGRVPGLGLLPLRTVFGREKTTERARGVVAAGGGLLAGAAGAPVTGYEIHMGRTVGDLPAPLRMVERRGMPVDEPDGAASADGLVLGTYLHGLFDSPALRGAILRNLAARKGVPPRAWGDEAAALREDPFDRLADHVRASLDMRRLYGIIGLG